MADNDERKFEYYLNLPAKNRQMVVDEMDPADRCRFTRCSKLSRTEATISKNFIYKLKIEVFSRDDIKITVMYGNHSSTNGFCLAFTRRFKEYKVYCDLNNQELWADELFGSRDLFQCAIKEFKNRLHQCQNVVRKLCIVEHASSWDPKFLTDVDFGIESLDNLEQLAILAEIEVEQIFPKLQRPLKKLFFASTQFNQDIVNWPQLYLVQNTIVLWFTHLENEQFSRLSAENVTMPIGRLSEYHILRFIRSWQNGSIGRNIGSYRWNIYENSNFSMQKLTRILRIKPQDTRYDDSNQLEIKHFHELGKYALLSYSHDGLQFSTGI